MYISRRYARHSGLQTQTNKDTVEQAKWVLAQSQITASVVNEQRPLKKKFLECVRRRRHLPSGQTDGTSVGFF